MINPQLFFVKGTIGDLKRIATKYPLIRRLYSRTDLLRGYSIVSVLATLCDRDNARRRMESVWHTAIITNEFCNVTTSVARLMTGRDVHVSFVPQGGMLPRIGFGFAFCPSMPMHTSAILLDDMRVMRWCSETCVPTFGLAKTLADTVLVHAEA